MAGDFGRGHRDECPDLLNPSTLNKAAKCGSGVIDGLLFIMVATRVRGDLGRLDLQVRNQLVCRAEVVTLTCRVLPDIKAEIRRREAEMIPDCRLIDLEQSLPACRLQGASGFRRDPSLECPLSL